MTDPAHTWTACGLGGTYEVFVHPEGRYSDQIAEEMLPLGRTNAKTSTLTTDPTKSVRKR